MGVPMISVLCVDDEPGLLKIEKIFLERDKDLKVTTVTSAIEGLSALSTNSIDAIVSDYQMPEMDGIEFLKRVRSLDGVPFILFTGKGREEVAIEAINNGVDFYLQKGLEPKSQFTELAHKIKHAVNKRRLEELLVKSEQKFHTFADYTIDWEYWQLEDNAYVYITPSCERITGYTADEFKADPNLVSTIIYPDDRNKWINHRMEETHAKDALSLEIRIVRKDGEIRWIDHRCHPVSDTAGKTQGRRTGNRDITRQKQDEEKLFAAYKQLAAQDTLLKQQYESLRMTDVMQKESTRFLDDIFSSIQDGISILDQDLTILKVNATMERWYAHSMPLVGKKCYEAYHLRTGPCENCPTIKAIRSGKATMETIPKIGPEAATTGWLDLYSFPLIDSQSGQMNGIIEYARDITKRKQAEQEFATSEERYRRLFESAKDGILILDYENGSIIDANPFIIALLGYSREGLLGKKLSEIGLIADTSRAEKIFESLKKEEYARYDNLPLLAKDGRSLAVEFISNVYTVNHGKVIQCSVRDISERVRIECRLQESEDQFRTIIETANEGIWIMDESYATAFINARMAEILGYTSDEMIGHAVTDFMFPEDLPADCQRMESRIKGKAEVYEQKFRHKNGNAVMCLVSATPRMDNQQKFRGSFAMVSDITERKRTEDLLRESEDRFRFLFEQSPIPYQSLDDDGRFLAVNDAWLTTLGYDRDEVIGHPFSDFIAPEFSETYRINYPKFKTAGEIHVEFKMKRKDGNLITVAFDGKIGHFPDGSFRQSHCVFQDVSERKRAEEALRVALVKYKTLFDTFPLGVMVSDSEGRILESNPMAEKLLGLSPEEINQRKIDGEEWQIVRPDGTPLPPEEFASVRALGEKILIENQEMGIVKARGEITWISVTAAPLPLEGYGVVITYGDITKNKIAEDALKESEERLGSIIRVAPIGIGLVSGRVILEVNDYICQMTGYTKNELVGQSSRILYPSTEEFDRVGKEKYAAIEETGTGIIETRWKRKDGKKIDILLSSTALNPVDLKEGVTFTALDITKRKRAEEELHLFKDLVEHSSDAIGMSTPEGRHYYQNQAFNLIFGTIGDYPPDTVYVDKSVGEHVFDTIMSGGIWQGEIKMFRPDRTVIDIFQRAYPIRNKNGNIIAIVGLHTDITERKRVEEALRESEEQLRIFFEKGPIGMGFISDTFRFIKVNPALCRILGYSEEEMSRLSIRDITHPDHIKADMAGVKNLMDGEIHLYATEKRYLSKSGKTIWASTTVIAIRDDKGKFRYFLVFVEDITYRKITEHVLVESEAKYRDLVENAGTIIMQMNAEGKITYFNEFAQKFFGFSEQEILGRSPVRTIMPETESVTGRDLGYIIKNQIDQPEKYLHHETEIVKKDGGRFWVAWRNKPQYDEDGKIYGIVSFGLDITDRRKAEEALFQANKKLNLLSSITRHDILNQLTALSGYIELSKEVTQDAQVLDFITREKRAANNIQNLISFTKDYQDVGQYRPMWQSINTIVHLLAKTVDLKSTNLIINLSHLEIYADPLLEKVIYTLLENAMRHGGPPNSIRFSYQIVDKGCLILCEDDGTGIPAADKEKIFERGFGKHTGFGLFLSREILGITGFSIRETGIPGTGARFEIFVPHGSFRIEQKIP